MQKSRLDTSRSSMNLATPIKGVTDRSHYSNIYLDKSRFTEVTIETNDQDVPYIALYKPNFSREKHRIQAASKLLYLLKRSEQIRVIHALNKILALNPKEKLINVKTLYLNSQLQKIIEKRLENGFKSLTVHRIKNNGSLLAGKLVWKIQNSVLTRNIKNSMIELRRNRLLMLVHELSNENEQAKELNTIRAEFFRLREEDFSEEMMAASKIIQKFTNHQQCLSTIDENDYTTVLKNEIKRFQHMRHNSSPRQKDLLNNETMVSVTSNIISAYKNTVKDYEIHCEKIQNELAGYKDAEGIEQLREALREKDNLLRDIEAFVGELTRMDIELKKFTPQNKLLIDRLSSTLMAHDKKIQARSKDLDGTSEKIATSRLYLSKVMLALIKKIEGAQNEQKEAQSAKREHERAQTDELRQLRRELQNTKNELTQERSKLTVLIEKRETKKSLEDLKRKWKGSEQMNVLLEYLISLHQKIEQYHNQQRKKESDQDGVIQGLEVIKTYISKGLQKIKESYPPPKSKQFQLQSLNEIQISIQNLYVELQVGSSQVERKNKSLWEKILLLEKNTQKSERDRLENHFKQQEAFISTTERERVITHENDQALVGQMRERFLALERKLLERQSASINSIFERNEQILKDKNVKLQEELSKLRSRYKSENRLEHKIIQLQNSLIVSQQRILILQKTTHTVQIQGSSYENRDREIQLLHRQIASLQEFLGDISHEYKQLQGKYHQEKHRFGRFYDNAEHERSIEQIDKAIHSLGDNSKWNEEVKSMVNNNEQLHISIEELQAERKKLLEKARAVPGREYVVELLFNILLEARHLSPQSQKGNSIWNELVQINQRCTEVGELFTELEKFSLKLLSLP